MCVCVLLNQLQLFLSRHLFNTSFAFRGQRTVHLLFLVSQGDRASIARVLCGGSLLVSIQASLQVIRNSCVERPIGTLDDVDPPTLRLFLRHRDSLTAVEAQKQVE